jgi:hypothetical protein
MRLANPLRASLVAASFATLAVGPLAAQQAAAPAPKGWENTVTLYGWGAAMSGWTTIGPVSAAVDVSFSEIWDNLKMGGMLNYQGRSEKWVAVADMIYMKLGSDVANPSTGNTLAEVTLKQWLLEGDGGYRVKPWLDVLVGLRVPIIEAEIVPDRDNPLISTKSNSETWVAPIIGARVELPFAKKFTGIARGDFGGFDIGGTNTTWQLAGYVNYRFGKGWSGTVGYRAISADYLTGSGIDTFKYDITNFGPVFGVSYTF